MAEGADRQIRARVLESGGSLSLPATELRDYFPWEPGSETDSTIEQLLSRVGLTVNPPLSAQSDSITLSTTDLSEGREAPEANVAGMQSDSSAPIAQTAGRAASPDEQRLRNLVHANGGKLVIGVDDLSEQFRLDASDGQAEERLEDRLGVVGLKVSPSLVNAAPGGQVMVSDVLGHVSEAAPQRDRRKDPANNSLASWGWLMAFLFTPIGFVIGIVLMNRKDVRGGHVMIASAVVAVALFSIYAIQAEQAANNAASSAPTYQVVPCSQDPTAIGC